MLGLLGPNGAGKTTAVRILTTLLRPTPGAAEVAGIDVLADPAGVRSRIGLSGQYAAVDEYLTGFENLDMIGRLYHLGRRRSRERARELLDRFDLDDAGDRPAKTYSGGMRRRLDLAGALVADPPVLFLDEPTTGLDPRSRTDMWEVIAEPGRRRHHAAAHHAVPRGGRPARRRRSSSSTTAGSSPRAPPTSSRRRSAASASRSPSPHPAPLADRPRELRRAARRSARPRSRSTRRSLLMPVTGGADGARRRAAPRSTPPAIALDDVGLRRPDPRRRVPHADRPRRRGRPPRRDRREAADRPRPR